MDALEIFEIQSTPPPHRALESYKLRWSPSLCFCLWGETKPLSHYTLIFFNLYVIRINKMKALFVFHFYTS